MRVWASILLLVIASCGGGSGGSGGSAPPPTPITISPSQGSAIQTAEVQFTTTGPPVSWSVREGAIGGSITSSGLYTAPVNLGTFHVVATSLANSSLSATATIRIEPAVRVFPTSDTLGPGGVRSFGVDVNPPVPSVTWTILEGPAGGSISGNTYTAPDETGTYRLVATSTLDSRLSFTVPITVVPRGFLPVGDLILPRVGHTATLLPNGRVLIAGGDPCWVDDGVCPLQETEIFDPASGTFQPASNMIRQRAFHTATTLPNGTVLFTGGSSPATELYDPGTGTFTTTGGLRVNRAGHTATLLTNGKVLIAGGQTTNSALATAELYDPQTGTFSPTGGNGMTTARSGHTATRLPSGHVLITGGFNPISTASTLAVALSSAELYEPDTETFIPTGRLSVARAAHTATMLGNGSVLIAGGIGSQPDSVWLDSAEIYTFASGQFSATTTMLMPRVGFVAVMLPDGTVLLTGGPNGAFEDGREIQGFSAEIYDPATRNFTRTGSMIDGFRFVLAAVLLADGRVLVTGSLNSLIAEVYQ